MFGQPPEAKRTRRTQRAFLDDLLGRSTRSAAQRRAAFRQPRRSSIEDRWHIYAHGFTARITEALEAEFMAIRRILGEAAFTRLIERYLAVFTPRSFDLGHAGDRLSRFLEYDSLAIELPFLPDLARLERKIAQAFVSADARPLTWEGLQSKPPAEAARLSVALAPAVALVRSEWPLHDLWQCRTEGVDEAIDIRLQGRPQDVLVTRRGGSVRCEPIGSTAAAVVEASAFGDATLGDLQELVIPGGDAAAVARLLEEFRDLVTREVFVIRRHTGSTGVIEL